MTLTLIDTFGFFFRSYFAMPRLNSKSGHPTGLLTGFLNFINTIQKDDGVNFVIFALEGRGQGAREKIYPEYKGNRPDAPEDFKLQLPIAINWLEKMGYHSVSIDGYEADDVIASYTKKAVHAGLKVRIVSHDKDLYQLINDSVSVWDPTKKKTVTEVECIEKFGVKPSDFIEFQALIGDSVDNVPGVRGIGPKTAEKLINEYKTVENIYANIENIVGNTREKLQVGKDSAFMSRKLVTLVDDLQIDMVMEHYKKPIGAPFEQIRDEMLGFDIKHLLAKNSLLESAIYESKSKDSKFSFEPVLLNSKEKLFTVLDKIPNNTIVAFDSETTDLDTKIARLVGFSFSFEPHTAYYVPVTHNYLGVGMQVELSDALEAISKILKHKITGHNLKFDLSLIYRLLGCSPIKPACDTMVLAWMINSERSVSLDSLAEEYFEHKMIKYSQTVKKSEDFSSVDIESACKYAAEDAAMSLALYNALFQKTKDINCENFIDIMNNVELDFINTLIDIESCGVKVDTGFLRELNIKTISEIDVVSNEIYSLAGGEFNINSTQQLASILYTKLGLNSGKKTKTGLSTDERTLTKIEDEHPIISKILEYRELFKLKSTYIEPLTKYAEANSKSRIFTSFLQTGTATGRLSSKNPNLQNIPTKTDLGRQIRYAFIADSGKLLLGLDYSQIELRLLAHFSEDMTLVNAFKNNTDIHLETAKKIFGVELALENRNKAKTINFGLLYGMGSVKLSDTLGIDKKEAKRLIEDYFESFPTLKDYIEGVKQKAKEIGYSQTLIGRRRYFNFRGANGRDEAMYLREAVNTVFQGSAADLIKMSMNKINHVIRDENLPVKMILQIHDELIFEVDEQNVNEIGIRFQKIMEEIYTLKVPLKTSLNIAKNWGELK
jgi:DNA polymerase-1